LSGLIVGRTLYEIKTTAPKRPTPDYAWIYQLIGYALRDFDDKYRIERVGFVLPRLPAAISFDLDALIERAAVFGVPTGEVAGDIVDTVPVTRAWLRQQLRDRAWERDDAPATNPR
jgi:hypothetical protein